MKCKKCGYEVSEIKQVFKNGTKHIKLVCEEGHFNGYKTQDAELGEFIMPIGKHKGEKLDFIKINYPDYLFWCAENMDNKIGKKIDRYLSEC